MLTMIQGRKLPGLFEIPSRGPLFREPLSPIIPAHSNFRAYAQDAVLPRMELSPTLPPLPPPGHRSHANRLSIIWEAYRRLEYVLNITHFPQAVVEFCTTNLPTRPTGSSDGDEENGGGISVVAPAFKTGRSIPIGKPSDVDRVLRWVMEYPLATVNHMVHLVYPRTADFTLQEGKNKDDDGEIFRWVVWSRDENTITEAQDTWSESVLIMVQPPWILTEADLDWFIRTNHLPVEKPHRRLKSNERLWGKVWDMCAYKRAHWFVLTTYWGWVFGCFSKRWTRAYTSRVIPFDSKQPDPTVIQCLFFWFSCAAAHLASPQGAWSIPEVPEPLEDWEINSNPDVDRAEIEPSESSWDARSNARSHTPSGADSDEEDARTVMLELFPELASSGMRPPPDPPLGVTNDMLPSGAHEVDVLAKIATWVERIESGDHHQRRRRTQHGPPSIAPSVTSITTVSSLSTVRDFADEEHRKGTWMAPEDRPGGFSR